MAYRPGQGFSGAAVARLKESKKVENGEFYSEPIMEVARRSVIVIGNCGASGSGKSTFAQLLSERLNCPYKPLSADDCLHEKPELWPQCHHSFPGKRSHYCEESAHAIDHKKLARQVSVVAGALRTASPGPVPASDWAVQRAGGEPLGPPGAGRTYVIVEGFKIFAEEELVRCCDRLIWLEVDRETCFQRAARPRPNHRPATRDEYEGHRWPVHLEFRNQMLANAEAHPSELFVLANGDDGEEATSALADEAMHRLRSSMVLTVQPQTGGETKILNMTGEDVATVEGETGAVPSLLRAYLAEQMGVLAGEIHLVREDGSAMLET